MSWDHSWDSFPTQTGKKSPDLSQFLLPSSLSIFFFSFVFQSSFYIKQFWGTCQCNIFRKSVLITHYVCTSVQGIMGESECSYTNTYLWELCDLVGRGVLSITPMAHCKIEPKGSLPWDEILSGALEDGKLLCQGNGKGGLEKHWEESSILNSR